MHETPTIQLQEESSNKAGRDLGSLLFLTAFFICFLKWVPSQWPLALGAFCCYLAVHLLRKKGWVLSLVSCLLLTIYLFLSGSWSLWIGLFLGSIALSVWIVHLVMREREEQIAAHGEKIDGFKEKNKQLEKQLWEMKSSFSEMSQKFEQSKQALKAAQESIKISSEKIQALEHELSQPKVEISVPVEEPPPDHKYTLLREQFEEKSMLLDATRKELFHLENAYLGLQKASDENRYAWFEEDRSLVKDLKQLEEEKELWEAEVLHLQELVSRALLPKRKKTSAE